MIAYATRTGTRKNLKALADAKWGLLVSAAGVWRTEGFTLWVADNGAWHDFMAGKPFDEARFARFLGWLGAQIRAGNPPQWLVLPDIVNGGDASLDLSMRWRRILRRIPALRSLPLMLAVQNGMDAGQSLARVRRVIGPGLGVFIGGDTAWKESTLSFWGATARELGAATHCARVNSARRIRLCILAGIDSFDGTSASRYRVTLHPLDIARRQMDLEAWLIGQERRAA